MTSSGIKLTDGGKYDYVIAINTKEKEDQRIQRDIRYLLKTSISISFYDEKNNKEIGVTSFDLTSESYDGTEDARKLWHKN